MKPHALLSVFVVCGETEEKALQMRKHVDYILVQFEKGNFNVFPDYSTIQNYRFSSMELERIQYNSGRIISGVKEDVKEQLTKLAGQFDVDEIIISTMTASAEDRKQSFELLADVLELNAVPAV